MDAARGDSMSDIFKQQADWLKTWQENQEKMMKQYAGVGEAWMSNMFGGNKQEPGEPGFFDSDFFKKWFKPQGDLDGQFKEFSQGLNDMVNKTWGDKIPAEMQKFMNLSYFGEFYKNLLSSLKMPKDMKSPPGMDGGWQQATDFLHSFLEQNNSFFSSFSNNNFTGQMTRGLGMMLGTLGKEEGAFSDILNGYQDFFSKMYESTTAQSTEKLTEVFDTWAKEMEKHLSAPKLGINRELAHDMSQLLVLSQDYVRAYSKMARMVEATGRKAGI